MFTIDFSKGASQNLTERIYCTIKEKIVNGEFSPDEKLPSKRGLANHLGVSVITVQNAYELLIDEGYIYSIEKKGFYITNLSNSLLKSSKTNPPAIVEKSSLKSTSTNALYDFSSNSINAQNFPFSLWSHTMRQVLNSNNAKLLQRTDINGIFELRQSIAKYLFDYRNMSVSPEQIVIGAGAENLYSILIQFLGRDKLYAVENPGFKRTKQIFSLNGAKSIHINIDEQGIIPQQLLKTKANVIHISPNHHFPTGIIMPIKRRMELLKWVNSSQQNYIIEDDYDSEFRFNGKPLPTLQSLSPDSSIIFMNTFSKTLLPSFRIGYMVLPQKLISSFKDKMNCYSCPVSSFEQLTLANFIFSHNFEKHINRMKNYYKSLRNNLILELKKSKILNCAKILEKDSGLHFILSVQNSLKPEKLQDKLLNEGIKIPLLKEFYYDDSQKNTCDFVINYSALDKKSILQIVQIMAKIFLT